MTAVTAAVAATMNEERSKEKGRGHTLTGQYTRRVLTPTSFSTGWVALLPLLITIILPPLTDLIKAAVASLSVQPAVERTKAGDTVIPVRLPVVPKPRSTAGGAMSPALKHAGILEGP